MSNGPISLIPLQYAKPEKRDMLASILTNLADTTRAEDSCITYELSTLADDLTVFCFFERWKDQSALGQHLNSKEFQKFWEARMDYLLRDVEIKFLQEV